MPTVAKNRCVKKIKVILVFIYRCYQKPFIQMLVVMRHIATSNVSRGRLARWMAASSYPQKFRRHDEQGECLGAIVSRVLCEAGGRANFKQHPPDRKEGRRPANSLAKSSRCGITIDPGGCARCGRTRSPVRPRPRARPVPYSSRSLPARRRARRAIAKAPCAMPS
jgi:hypothetical protein